MTPILEFRDVHAGYGPFRALFGVSLSLPTAGVVALLGSNGAGKTTIARVASGLVAPTQGAVLIDGVEFAGRRPWEFARQGFVHAPEGRSVFGSLTVSENLELALRFRHRSALAARIARAYELFPRLGERQRQLAGTLSGGEQRMLALSRVMVDEPRVLIADELSLGLAPLIVDEVYETLRAIQAAGTALLIVEQHVAHALAIAETVVVLDRGRVQFAGPVGELHDVRALPGRAN